MKYPIVFLLFGLTLVSVAADMPDNYSAFRDASESKKEVSDIQSAQFPNVGTVLKIIQSKNYTYIKIKNKQIDNWLATPKLELLHGAKIRYGRGVPMVNFYSNSLKREFPEILLVEQVQIVE